MLKALGVSAVSAPNLEAAKSHIQGRHDLELALLGHIPGDRDAALVDVANSFECLVVLYHAGDDLTPEQAFLGGAAEVIKMPATLREIAMRLQLRAKTVARDLNLFKDKAIWSDAGLIANRVGLTEAETQILSVLLNHRNEIVSRDTMSQIIDGRPWDYGDRKFDVHVAKIRKKIMSEFNEDMSVTTVRSAGYRLSVDAEDLADLTGICA